MKLLEAIVRKFPAPRLTPKRIVLAFTVALAADAIQLAMLPLGPIALLPDEAIDVVAMALTCWLLGFHVLLLPTFILELVPGLGMLPTWTGCVAAVVALRKREQSGVAVREEIPSTQPSIEVPATPAVNSPPQLPPGEPSRLAEAPSRPADGVDANPS